MNKTSPSQAKGLSYSTFIGKLCALFFNLILVMILSWIILTVYFCVKLWVLDDLLILKKIPLISDVTLRIIEFINHNYATWLIYHFKDWQTWLQSYLNYVVEPKLSESIVSIVLGSLEIIITRGLIFVWSLPLLILIHFVLIVDGLVQRDIRKFKGAKESAFFFHRMSSISQSWLLVFFFIYTVIAVPVSPNTLLIPMIIGSAFFTMLSIKNYKKYL